MSDCLAETMELELMPDHSVRIILRCADAYKAAVLYEDIVESTAKGILHLEFELSNVRTK